MDSVKVVSNSSPLINLSKIDRLDLLEKLYGKVFIPNAVFEELILKADYPRDIEKITSLIQDKVIEVKIVKDINFVRALRKDLDSGESEVIALAKEESADLVIIDEVDARRIAEFHDLNKTGFIGILIKAKKNGFVGDVIHLIDIAVEKGFWINKDLYQQISNSLR
jgi:predicted nucleic acid-binding protein